jgi:hypothetical protein
MEEAQFKAFMRWKQRRRKHRQPFVVNIEGTNRPRGTCGGLDAYWL